MIRKAIIVVLTFGTVGTVILGVANLVLPRPIIWKRVSTFPTSTVTVQHGVFSVVHWSESDKKLSSYQFGIVERNGIPWPTPSGSYLVLRRLTLPLWIPFVLFGAYPTFALFRGPLRRQRRRRRGECIGCGYDLTGNESGVCPECGSKTGQPVSVGR